MFVSNKYFLSFVASMSLVNATSVFASKPEFDLPRDRTQAEEYRWFDEKEIPKDAPQRGSGWYYETECSSSVQGFKQVEEASPLSPGKYVKETKAMNYKCWAWDGKANARCQRILSMDAMKSEKDAEKLSFKDLAMNMCVDHVGDYFCGAQGPIYREHENSGQLIQNGLIVKTSYNTLESQIVPPMGNTGRGVFKQGNGVYETVQVQVKPLPHRNKCQVEIQMTLPNLKKNQNIRCDGSKKEGVFGWFNPVEDDCRVTMTIPFDGKRTRSGVDCQEDSWIMANANGLAGFKAPSSVGCAKFVEQVEVNYSDYKTLPVAMKKDKQSVSDRQVSASENSNKPNVLRSSASYEGIPDPSESEGLK